jgi:hypothetical protein
MYNYKKDNNNKDKDRNNSSKYKSKEFNLKLVTWIKATITRYKY